jgi:hypothetical protein
MRSLSLRVAPLSGKIPMSRVVAIVGSAADDADLLFSIGSVFCSPSFNFIL